MNDQIFHSQRSSLNNQIRPNTNLPSFRDNLGYIDT